MVVFAKALFLFLLVSMAALFPFVHSSRFSFHGVRSVPEVTALAKREFENGGSFLDGEERQVPTGPDPLHHNSKPGGH